MREFHDWLPKLGTRDAWICSSCEMEVHCVGVPRTREATYHQGRLRWITCDETLLRAVMKS